MPRHRVAIVGGPRTGKTTFSRRLAETLGLPLVHTDDFIPLGWAGSGAKAAEVIARARRVIIEGVAVPRALRRLLKDHPRRRPIEALIILGRPKVKRTKGQEAMAKGLTKILAEIVPELARRGVVITRRR
jgi:adenylate kinase family enzyme